jgi:lipopolysaccharide export system permease protein
MSLLQRYVLAELLRVFALLLAGLTVLLVFVGVAGEVSKFGLGPYEVAKILPFIVPSLMPFTIPATLLLTVCVVYGRMSGDQEVTAVKAAGINVMSLLWPSFFLGVVLSVATLILTDQFIPWARANIENIITLAMEDIFLSRLRTHNQVSDPTHGIAITVLRVDGKKLIKPIFRYTSPGGGVITIQAEEAQLEFDLPRQQQVLLDLHACHISSPTGATMWVAHRKEIYPLRPNSTPSPARNLSIDMLQREMDKIGRMRIAEDQRRVIASVFSLSQGEFPRLGEPAPGTKLHEAIGRLERFHKLNTEVHSRYAMACSCLFFVLIGSPFSILQARRQFLTNFFLCFLPILLVYYPVVLLFATLSKGAEVNPAWAMWVGNTILIVASGVILRKVLQH